MIKTLWAAALLFFALCLPAYGGGKAYLFCDFRSERCQTFKTEILDEYHKSNPPIRITEIDMWDWPEDWIIEGFHHKKFKALMHPKDSPFIIWWDDKGFEVSRISGDITKQKFYRAMRMWALYLR